MTHDESKIIIKAWEDQNEAKGYHIAKGVIKAIWGWIVIPVLLILIASQL